MGIHFFILYVITKINLKFRKFKYNNLFIKFIINLSKKINEWLNIICLFYNSLWKTNL